MARVICAAVACCVCFVPIALNAAPIVTLNFTPVVRTHTQGAGTYNAVDFYLTNGTGAEFTHYRLIVTSINGNMFDPAKLQDDRQQDDTSEANTAGSVDTYANTVMSAAAKQDGGYSSTIVPNAGSYVPTGTGAAAPFTFLDWNVFDTATGDDNNLNDLPPSNGGPFAVTAPYHIARVLFTPNASGTASFQAFDTLSQGVPTTFNYNWCPEPSTLSLFGLATVCCLGFRRRRGA